MDPNIIIQQAQHIETQEERLSRYQREAADQHRHDESHEVHSARAAHERAQERLARVNQLGQGYRNYSYEDREEAKRDATEKEREYRKVSNEAARASYLKGLEDKKQAQKNQQAAVSEKARLEAETQLRATYLGRWTAAGGDEQGFNASWPSIRDEHYKRAMFEQGNALENSLRAGSSGIL